MMGQMTGFRIDWSGMYLDTDYRRSNSVQRSWPADRSAAVDRRTDLRRAVCLS